MRKMFFNVHFLFWILTVVCFVIFSRILNIYVYPLNLALSDVFAMEVLETKTLILSMGGTMIFSAVAFVASLFKAFSENPGVRLIARLTAFQSVLFALVSVFLLVII